MSSETPEQGQGQGQGQSQGQDAAPRGPDFAKAGGGTTPTAPAPKAKRRIRNFVLQPLLQVKVGFYSILLSALFAASMGAILYFNFSRLVKAVIDLTDAPDDVLDIFKDTWSEVQLWLYLAFAVYLIAQIGLAIIYTHRLVGPTYAFRKHIQSIASGNFRHRTFLRQGDAFVEVAQDLNRLSELMDRHFNGGGASAKDNAKPK